MKSQVPAYFDEWLTLMEKAHEILDEGQFQELEDRIIAEITAHRKRERRDQGTRS